MRNVCCHSIRFNGFARFEIFEPDASVNGDANGYVSFVIEHNQDYHIANMK